MGQVRLEFHVEADALQDAAAELVAVLHAVALRHGVAFRALERRIAAVVEATDGPIMVPLDEGRFIAMPPAEWTAIIRDARQLGLIA